jgi:predicted nucleic acid-binding protein
MKPEEEVDTFLLLSQFKTASIDQKIIDIAAALYRRWQPSHSLGINDAILAATVMQTGGQIFCLNTKHYPMPNLLVKKAW